MCCDRLPGPRRRLILCLRTIAIFILITGSISSSSRNVCLLPIRSLLEGSLSDQSSHNGYYPISQY